MQTKVRMKPSKPKKMISQKILELICLKTCALELESLKNDRLVYERKKKYGKF